MIGLNNSRVAVGSLYGNRGNLYTDPIKMTNAGEKKSNNEGFFLILNPLYVDKISHYDTPITPMIRRNST